VNSTLVVHNLDKQYPGVHALKNLDLEIFEGEVHALLGENGAGKSTFMKIIGGEIHKDQGEIFLGENKVPDHYNTSVARSLGIAMVYQELSLVPAMTVAENIYLRQFAIGSPFGITKWKDIFKQADDLVSSFDLSIDVRAKVKDLGIATQQLVEILRATVGNPKVLLLDEPTSALAQNEIETLFDKIIRPMKARGVSIIFISHKLDESFAIADRITVMRDGEKVGTTNVDDTNEDKIISMMVGRQIEEKYFKRNAQINEIVLGVDKLSKQGLIHNCSFSVRAGEIVGISGLMGAGRTELAKTLSGIISPDSGTITLHGNSYIFKSPDQAIKKGIGYLNEDRHEGLVLQQSISPNITLANFSEIFSHGVLNRSTESEIGNKYIKEFSIEAWGEKQIVKNLSGGNQQKVAIARWVYANTEIFIMDEPTRGIDVGAKVEVYRIMDALVQAGKAIILISSELPEIMSLADRIYVMYNGTIVDELERKEFNEERIMRSSAGMR
jgi:ABC-type sugar transport system ATPase subunit